MVMEGGGKKSKIVSLIVTMNVEEAGVGHQPHLAL